MCLFMHSHITYKKQKNDLMRCNNNALCSSILIHLYLVCNPTLQQRITLNTFQVLIRSEEKKIIFEGKKRLMLQTVSSLFLHKQHLAVLDHKPQGGKVNINKTRGLNKVKSLTPCSNSSRATVECWRSLVPRSRAISQAIFILSKPGIKPGPMASH